MVENQVHVPEVDRRVRRTRHALRDALVALILEKGYEATTVQDIVARADVGRSTFYAHFVDKEALLLGSFQELHIATGSAAGGGPQSLFAISQTMFRQAESERRLFRAIFGRFSAGPLHARMEQEVFEWVRSEFEKIAPRADERSRTMAARATVSAFLGLLRWWLDADQPPPSDEIGDAFVALMLPGVASVLRVAPEEFAPREAARAR